MKNSPLNDALGKRLRADRALFRNWGPVARIVAIVFATLFVVAAFRVL